MRDCTELVIQAQAGDREALAQLVAAVQEDVWHLLSSRLRNDADAEDAAQETLTQAIVSLHQLREPRAFAGWLFRIALDKARRVRRAAPAAAASEPVAKPEADPMERDETRQAVRRAVKSLDETLRTTVELRYEHGLAYADIARAMDCPEGTVSDRLHTAHDRLKRVLAGVGLVLTMAMLEREASGAPRSPVPPRLAKRLGRLARKESPVGNERGWRRFPRAAALVLLLFAVGAWIGVRSSGILRRDGAPTGGTDRIGDSGNGKGNSTSPGGGSVVGGSGRIPSSPDSAVGALPLNPAMAVVEGHVRATRDGRAIEGARVWLKPATSGNGGALSTATGADGAYRIQAPAGDYDLHASAEGFLEHSNERSIEAVIETNSGRATDEGVATCRVRLVAGVKEVREIELKFGIVVHGRVVDEQGVAVGGAEVEFEGQSIEWEEGNSFGISYCPDGESETVTTDLEGRFAFPGVYPAGRVSLSAKHEGFVEAGTHVSISGSNADVTIELRRGIEIAGEVVDDLGMPIAGAKLLLGTAADSAQLMREETADAEGRFRFANLPVNTKYIAAYAPGHGWALAQIGGSPAGPARLVLPPATGILKGCVRDSHGQLLAGVEVRVASFDLVGEGKNARLGLGDTVSWSTEDGPGVVGCVSDMPQGLTTVTREDGTFEIRGVPVTHGTPVGLVFEKEGYDPLARTVESEAWLDASMPTKQ